MAVRLIRGTPWPDEQGEADSRHLRKVCSRCVLVEIGMELFRRTLRENLLGQVSMGIVLAPVCIGVFICGGALMLFVAWSANAVLISLSAVIAGGAMLITSSVYGALGAIYAALLYRSAKTGSD